MPQTVHQDCAGVLLGMLETLYWSCGFRVSNGVRCFLGFSFSHPEDLKISEVHGVLEDF